MAFADEIKKASNKPKLCLQIDGDQNTHRFSDCGLKSTNWWKPRIMSCDGPRRSLDLQGHDVRSEETVIDLNNADGMIMDLFDAEQLQGSVATLLLKMKDSAATVHTETQTAGIIEVRSMTPEAVRIAIRPNVIERIGILQNTISDERLSAFPLPEEAVGLGMPIIIGKTFASGNFGAVHTPHIDETNNAEKHIVHQGPMVDNATAHLYRLRAGVWTDLGVSGGPNWELHLNALDDLGGRFSYAQHKAGAHDPGDESYFDGFGIPGEGYVDLNGTNEYYKLDSADSVNFPGHDRTTGAFTFYCKFRIDSIINSDSIGGVWDGGAAATTSWWIRKVHTDDKLRFYLREDITLTQYIARCDTTLIDDTTKDYIVWIKVDLINNECKIWIGKDGGVLTAQALTETNTVPTILNASTGTPFNIGNLNNSGDTSNLLDGRLYGPFIYADGAQEPATGATSELDSPLEDIISEYNFHEGIPDDYVGDNNLTAVNVTAADYVSIDQVLNTPARILDALLRWKYYWGVPTTSLNRASFATLAAEQEADSWNDAAGDWFAGAFPFDNNSPVEDDTPRQFQHLLMNQDATMHENRNGRLTILSADISTSGSGSYALLGRHDFAEAGPRIERRAFTLRNLVRYNFMNNHRDGPEGFVTAEDVASQEAFGIITEDVQQTLYLVRDLDYVKALANRQLLRSASDARRVILPVAGLRGLQHSIGDTIRVTHPELPSGWDQQQVKLIGLDPNYMGIDPIWEGVERGKGYGPISYGTAGDAPQEYSITITPELDTYISEEVGGSAFGSQTGMLHGRDYPPGYKFRMMMRFDLSDIAAAGGTIISASLRLRTTFHILPMSIAIHQLNSTTWNEASTWNAFDGGGAWNEAYMLVPPLSDVVATYPLDYHVFTFTPAGVAYLDGRVGADNRAQLTDRAGQAARDLSRFATREHGTVAWRPQLTVIYTA